MSRYNLRSNRKRKTIPPEILPPSMPPLEENTNNKPLKPPLKRLKCQIGANPPIAIPIQYQLSTAPPIAEPSPQMKLEYDPNNNIRQLSDRVMDKLIGPEEQYKAVVVQIKKEAKRPTPALTSNSSIKKYQFYSGQPWSKVEKYRFAAEWEAAFDEGKRGTLQYQDIKNRMNSQRSIGALKSQFKKMSGAGYKYGDAWREISKCHDKLVQDQDKHASSNNRMYPILSILYYPTQILSYTNIYHIFRCVVFT